MSETLTTRELAYKYMIECSSPAYRAATYRRAVRGYRRAVDAHNAARQEQQLKTWAAMMVNDVRCGRPRKSHAIKVPLPDITTGQVRYRTYPQDRDEISVARIKRTWGRVVAKLD